MERLKSAGVQSVIPMLPENAFFPYVGAENQQKFFPQLLLSDYQSSIEVALGLIPVPYETALNGQEGVTTETLGGLRRRPARGQGGYDPGVRSCYATWHKAHPKPIKGTTSFYIEEQGPIQAWCTSIRLFAEAATNAGSQLNRRTFVTALSKIKNFPGGLSPVLELRSRQVLRPDDVHRGEDPQQRATVVAMRPEDQPQAAGHVLGRRAEGEAAAHVARPSRWCAEVPHQSAESVPASISTRMPMTQYRIGVATTPSAVMEPAHARVPSGPQDEEGEQHFARGEDQQCAHGAADVRDPEQGNVDGEVVTAGADRHQRGSEEAAPERAVCQSGPALGVPQPDEPPDPQRQGDQAQEADDPGGDLEQEECHAEGGEDERGEPDHLARGDPPGSFGRRRGHHGHGHHCVVEVRADERARGKSENRREAG